MVSQNQRTKAIEKRIARGKEVDERRGKRKKERENAQRKERKGGLFDNILSKISFIRNLFLLIFLFLFFINSCNAMPYDSDMQPIYDCVPEFSIGLICHSSVTEWVYGDYESIYELGSEDTEIWIVGLYVIPGGALYGNVEVSINTSGEHEPVLVMPFGEREIVASGHPTWVSVYIPVPIFVTGCDSIDVRVCDHENTDKIWLVKILVATGVEDYAGFNLSAYCVSDPPLPEANVVVTENSIKWEWNFTDAVVWIDGELVDRDNDLGYYLLGSLDKNEKHRLEVFDIKNETLWYGEAKTNHSESYLFLIIFTSLLFIVLGLKFTLSPFLALLTGFYLLQLAIYEQQDGFFMLIAGLIMVLGIGYPVLLWKKK